MSTEEVKILSATVVEQGEASPRVETKIFSATVVEQGEASPRVETKIFSATVVERPLDTGGLGQGDITKIPNYIVENGTPYVKFDPNTNDKQLFFYPETDGTYQIIALRPNLLDFYEVEQTFSGPAQLIVPHFNQVFMTDRTLEDAERNQIKSAMLARATGTGIDIDAGTENSVPGGLRDPAISSGIEFNSLNLMSFVDLGEPYTAVSANQGQHGTTAFVRWDCVADCTVTYEVSVSSESSFDYGGIKLNGAVVQRTSGVNTISGSFVASQGDVVDFYYQKDGSVDRNADTATLVSLTTVPS